MRNTLEERLKSEHSSLLNKNTLIYIYIYIVIIVNPPNYALQKSGTAEIGESGASWRQGYLDSVVIKSD